MADDGVLDLHQVTRLVRDENPFALGHVRWLADPVLLRRVLHVEVQLVRFFGQNVRPRPKVEVVLAMDVLHPVYPVRKEVFPRQFDAPREVVHFLVLAQALEHSVLERLGRPHE